MNVEKTLSMSRPAAALTLRRTAPVLRRRELVAATAAGAAAVLVGCGEDAGEQAGGAARGGGGAGAGASGVGAQGGGGAGVTPTPSCVQTEDNELGPAYLGDAPFRTELNVLGWPGISLTISGRVRATDCTPIAGAILDVWQADDAGHYDGSSIDPDGNPAPDPAYPLRGRLETAADGSYVFSTLYPGLYTGRTRHIHLIASAPGYARLITQIYFAGVPENGTDGLIEPELIIELEQAPDGSLAGVFEVVLAKATG